MSYNVQAATDLNENVAVQYHKTVHHVGGYLDLVLLQLTEHAEQHIVRVAVVTCAKTTLHFVFMYPAMLYLLSNE